MSTTSLAVAFSRVRTASAPSDGQLLEAYAAANDQAAFAALVKRHGPMVLGLCRRVLGNADDAEDAFQAAFLVLATKADSIRQTGSLTSWLYGVAYRLALRAKRDAGRRRKHESRVEPRANPPAWEVGWRELQAVLDEEVQRLAPADRATFVLCCLEGLSKTEAAERLGLKANTVSSQLARARRRLQEGLARRGISLAAVLAALAVSGAGRAALSPRLVRVAMAAACRLGAGTPVTGLSARALSLAEGVTTMLANKTKRATVLLVALCVLGTGLGLLARSATPPAQPTKPPAPAVKDEGGQRIAYGGQVLGPDGRPVAGARVYLTLSWGYLKRPAPSSVHATTGPDGRFQFTVPKRQYGQHVMAVVAVAAGHGPAWVEVRPEAARDKLELRLVKDVPINGQVLDLQGKPVRGVTVRVLRILAAKEENLGPWVEAARAGKQAIHELDRNYLSRQLISPEIPGLPQRASTDSAGRFRLTGIGRERMVVAQIEGPTITTRQVRIMTRAGKPIEIPEWKPVGEAGLDKPAVLTCYAATCIHAAAPTKPIVGVVRDRDTGKPLPGFTIRSHKLAHNPMHGVDFISTKTDLQGRYRLTGMPKGKDNKILVVPPKDQPYVVVHAVVPDSAGLDPVTVDFALRRGVWVEGKITDKEGKPLQSEVQYFALYSNPNLRHYAGYDGTFTRSIATGADGSYRVVGLPGPGMVAVRGYGGRYLLASEREDAEGSRDSVVYAAPFHVLAMNYHALARLDAARGAERAKRDVTLDPGWTFTGTVLGTDGKPLSGVRCFGLGGGGGWDSESLRTPRFTVQTFNPRRPRELLFQHLDKDLVGVGQPPKEKGSSMTVRMQPAATVTGRLLDADGQPRPGVALELTFRPKGMLSGFHYSPARIETDREGRFRMKALLPGYEFTLSDGRGSLQFGAGLRPGQTQALGDVRLK